MTIQVSSRLITTLSLIGIVSLGAACGSTSASPAGSAGTGGTTSSGGASGTAGTGAVDAAGETDPCNSGRCIPDGFPFATSAKAISDACVGHCPLLASDTPVGETTATLSQPKAGTLCLSGVAAPDGWAQIGLLFAVKNPSGTETLKTFDADSLRITQVAFTIDSPPSGGVSVEAGITIATSCPSDELACVANGFSLMTAPGSSAPLSITSPSPVIAPFADFIQSVGSQRFDTTALDHLVFSVGPGSYSFCVHDFRFLDANGREVIDAQP